MRKQLYTIAILFYCTSVVAQEQAAKKLFSVVPSSYSGVTFRNDIIEDANLYYYKYEYLYIGNGVAVGDINNDGLQDIYFSAATGFNKLYLNLGDFKFKDISETAGIGGELGLKTGVNMIDINNDGWLDLVASKSGPFDPNYREKIIYINNRDGSFSNKAREMGLADGSHSTQTYFLDYDKDGDMDAFLINQPGEFVSAMLVNAKMEKGKMLMIDDTSRMYVSHRLYENQNGTFKDISKKAGISTYAFGLSATMADFNQDGWPDIYVANDFKKPDYLYINNRNGTFSEKLSAYFPHIPLSSMGADMSDLNNDGLEDFFVADMAIEEPVRQKQLFVGHLNYDKFQLMLKFGMYYQYTHNVLQLNNGNGSYSDIAYYADIAETDWTWAPLIADLDNDGWKDFYITNGMFRDVSDWDYKEFVLDSIKNVFAQGKSMSLNEWFEKIPQVKVKNYFYRNNGSLKLDNYSDQWSDAPASFSNGAAYADLDNDGDLDLIVNNIADEAFLLRNNSNELTANHYLRFRLLKNKTTQQELYGTTVKLFDKDGNIQLQRFDPQRGYMSSVEHYVHFGTGKDSVVFKAEIIFPSGKQIILEHSPTNQVLTLYEEDAQPILQEGYKLPTVFSAADKQNSLSYTHKENDFIDFKREPLIPYKCSRKGPYYAKADVNGDGLEDMYIGGAAGSEGTLLLQSSNGSFVKKQIPVFTKDKAAEDAAAVFFDADGDKDNDLYVVSGGAEFPAGNSLYQDRLYLNDGKGNFTRSLTALPKENSNGSFVLTVDYDKDGDPDLFIGGGVMPGKFPQHDKNILLQNNKGIFTEVTAAVAPGLAATGIVNYAGWADTDQNGMDELVIAGEWMPVMIFEMKEGKLVKKESSVSIKDISGKSKTIAMGDIKGWWNTVMLDDIDEDGDIDIITGNRGLNSKITASLEEPCKVYAKDFDGNGSYDAVLGYYIHGKCYPMYHRDQLIDQMPFMRKKFIRYRYYAGKTLDEIFSEEQKKGMDIYTANCFESGVFINEGNNQFRFVAFPEMAQLSTINDIVIADMDKDGHKDIIAAGNSSDPDIGTGNYDAMASIFLKGDGKGNFKAVLPSGLPVQGEIRRIIPLANYSRFILLQNNAAAKTVSVN